MFLVALVVVGSAKIVATVDAEGTARSEAFDHEMDASETNAVDMSPAAEEEKDPDLNPDLPRQAFALPSGYLPEWIDEFKAYECHRAGQTSVDTSTSHEEVEILRDMLRTMYTMLKYAGKNRVESNDDEARKFTIGSTEYKFHVVLEKRFDGDTQPRLAIARYKIQYRISNNMSPEKTSFRHCTIKLGAGDRPDDYPPASQRV